MKQVLIADDDNTTRVIIERLVQRWGYHSTTAVDGEAAWQFLQSTDQVPSLAIIDWIMPGLNGLELCQKIKQQQNVFIYVILLTGRTESGDAVIALDAGADDFLTKPVQAEELRSRLDVGDRIIRYQLALAERNQQLQDEIVQRQHAEAQLRKMNAEKNKFLGIAAHDLRSPLSSIRGFSEMLLEDNLQPNESKEFLTIIHHVSKDMLVLLNDLLDISMIESGRFEIRAKIGRIDELVAYRVHLNQITAKRKNINFKCHLQSALEICYDPDRISQVVDNLLTNAVKYSAENTQVDIHVSQQKDDIEIKVIDQGVGIPHDQLDQLFGTFQRLSNKPTAGETSNGLGLAIVKKIIEAHHGTIHVESKAGKGSCFYVRLPMRRIL